MILGKCEYDPELRELSIEGQSPQVIGHVQAKLLQLLYSNPDQYFSNDDLQREVWDGRVIENTTIRTTVSYLRKALGESDDCKYIDSGRNKGYRFVADIEEITPQRQIKRFFPFAVIAGLAILLIYVVFQSSPPKVVPKIETTLVGQELEATVSGELMVFSHKAEGSKHWNLYSKKIGKERYFRLTEGEFDDKNFDLSDDGKSLAFNRYDGKECRVIIADISISMQKLSNEEVVFNCPKGSSLASIAWKDKGMLYLALADSPSGKFSLQLFDIHSKESTNITSSPDSGRGDYFVASNRTAKKIAYLRHIIGNKTEIWIYDEQSRRSRKLVTVPMILMSADWLNNNELVVKSGWGQISRLNINSGNMQTIFETTDRVSFPFAIGNSSVGFMKGFLTVRDIIEVESNGNSKHAISSSFRDFNPVYAEINGSITFISNRTGMYQIWVRNKLGELTQLTKFKNNLRISSLTISRDGRYIAFAINGHLHIMGADGTLLFKSKDRNLNKNPAFSYNSDKVFYASNINNDWFIEYRSTENFEAKTRLNRGYVIKPCNNSDCFYFIKHKDSVLYKSDQGMSLSTEVILDDIQNPDQLTVIDSLVYYIKRENGKSELLVQDIVSKEIASVMPLSTFRFSIQEKPFRVFTSISRETETLLQSIELNE